MTDLHHYPLEVDRVGTVIVDFRDHSGLLWLQHLIGDELAAYDIERGLFRALSRFLREDHVFWDVGANAGTVSAYVAKTFPKVKIFAFEPNPSIFSSLATLFSKVERVRVYPFALSHEDTTVMLTIPKGKSVGGSIEGIEYVLKTSSLTEEDVEQVTVKAFKGDSLLRSEASLLPPHVIKLDVEGHEPSALAGFAEIIRQHHPVIFFEHLYLSDPDVAKVVPEGYSIHSVDNITGELTPAFDRSVGHNSVLVPLRG